MTVRIPQPFDIGPAVETILSDEGLALAAGAADFLEQFVNGIPEHYAVTLKVDRTGHRDDVELAIVGTNGPF